MRLEYISTIILIISGLFSLVSEYYPVIVSNIPMITLLSWFIFEGLVIGFLILSVVYSEKFSNIICLIIFSYALAGFSIKFLFLQEDIFTIPMIIICTIGIVWSLYKWKR